MAAPLDRFLTRAIIALVSLIAGMVLGFVLARPRAEVTELATTSQVAQAEPIAAVEPSTAEPIAPVEPPSVEPAEPEPAEPEPPSAEPPTGRFIFEIRELSGIGRTKASIRTTAIQGSGPIEACLIQHGEAARVHYQLALTRSGEVAEILRLQGVNPELDACVEAVIESWKFGPSDESSFFKLKFIWSA